MGKAVKAGGLLLVVTALVWLTTLWRWETTRRDLRVDDVLVYLVVLPLAATAALLLTLWAVTGLRRYARSPLATAAPGAPATAAGSTLTPESERQIAFAVVAHSAHARGGADWAAQLQFAAQALPTLDCELRDEHGIAIFSSRLDEVSTDDVRAEVAAAVEAPGPERADKEEGLAMPVAAWRTLALLRLAVQDLLPPLMLQWVRHASPEPVVGAVREVQIRVAVPADWPPQRQALLQQWLGRRLELQVSSSAAPGLSACVHRSIDMRVHAVAMAEEFWHLTEQQLLQWHRDRVAGLLLVLAADSLLGPEPLGRLATAGGLFSGQHVAGRIPGEAAAGLLFATDVWLNESGDGQVPSMLMHRASIERREKSADAQGRASNAALERVLQQALAAAGVQAGEVSALTCDADHRASRAAELFETLQTQLPELDHATQLLRTPLATGEAGVARLLLMAALSASEIQPASGPLLLLGLQPAHERLAVVLRPAVPPAAAVA